jgi:hypothetical protein
LVLHSTSDLRYDTVTALEAADRTEFLAIFRREVTGLSYVVNQMLERESPEVGARWFAAEVSRKGSRAVAFLPFFLIVH